jgi:hypothetical protein
MIITFIVLFTYKCNLSLILFLLYFWIVDMEIEVAFNLIYTM